MQKQSKLTDDNVQDLDQLEDVEEDFKDFNIK